MKSLSKLPPMTYVVVALIAMACVLWLTNNPGEQTVQQFMEAQYER